MKLCRALATCLMLSLLPGTALAEAPSTSYIFPAGGQRGTLVGVRVGGHYLHDKAAWQVAGVGVTASAQLTRTQRIWFEGPLIKQPASQQSETYPQDYLASIDIAADAPLGPRRWRAWNAQGITAALPFIVGDLPEIIEQEMEGRPIPVEVALPVTINGRIFPREDVDIWSFHATAGQSITCKVAAQELGSALEAQLEVRDAQGQLLAESDREELRFSVPSTGLYEARITDSRFGGLQNYVYRLTITADAWIDRVYPLGGKRNTEVTFAVAGQKTPAELRSRLPDTTPGIVSHTFTVDGKSCPPLRLDVDELDEVLEPQSGELPTISIPGVANGRINKPGEADAWSFSGSKGQPLALEIRAACLGSPLDAVLVIKDSSGKEIARGDDQPDSPDPVVAFTPSTDGVYVAEITDKFASRGGEAFAYRLRVSPAQPDFRLTVASDAIGVDVGTEKKIPVTVDRLHGFKGPITLHLEGAPAGISIPETIIAPNQNRVDLAIKAADNLPVQLAKISLSGQGEHDGATLKRFVVAKPVPGPSTAEDLLLAVTLPTPFRYRGEYEFKYVPRGGILKKTFRIERGGYEGPLEVRLADRQGRHLQGVTGPTITVEPGQDTFEYPLALPPWMELGRTSRTNLMLTGEVADAAGVRHKVSFSTTEQNDQLIALVSPAPLRLSLERSAMSVTKNSVCSVTVQLHRDRSLTGPLTLEVVRPLHLQGVAAAPVTVPADQNRAELRLQIGDSPGPFTQPLVIRATSEHHGQPMVAEVPLELLLAK